MNQYTTYAVSLFKNIVAIDSPSGYTKAVIDYLSELATNLGYSNYTTNKGNLIIDVPGESDKSIGIAAHVDTLGLTVRGYKTDGTLSFAKIGGPILNTIDGEYCKIYTRAGKVHTGTILSNSPASHVFPDASTLARTEENMHIKLDCEVKSEDDVKALEILPGDFICFDTKTQVTDTGFIKSRFLDDKLSVAMLMSILKQLKDEDITPTHNIKVMFSTYEEIGHGLSHIPDGISEILAVDMGCIGLDLSCTEYDVSICAKDSLGHYDYEFTTRLIDLAKDNNLSYAVDIYPFYGSDVSAAYRAGHDVKGALIGAGIASSHGMERTHIKSVYNTMKLIMAYINS